MIATRTALGSYPPTTSVGWDSHVFVLRGDDRSHLRDRAINLSRFLDREPETNSTDLAKTLAEDLNPGGSRLAIVTTSIPDLQTKLGRAIDRLNDPRCKQIRDAGGIYFAGQPLFEQGTLALLFPGEGAQYPDMLADLCELFPEVEETFAWCDRLVAEMGQPEDSLRKVLHLPRDATPEERATAEARLRRLGPSIFGVLIADLALTSLLRNLALPVTAVAGHSAGELAALLACGAMGTETLEGGHLTEIMDLMERQEEEASGSDIALLAVGAGKAAVEELVRTVQTTGHETVIVAMDNCPHQCVAVGSTRLVAAVESALLGRGLVCERLPFRRPYHTPLFEPWMGPLRKVFTDIPFHVSHTPVYSGTTGQLFPSDPDAIRNLAVEHWVSPVEFVRMIETMYADGVRIFVEAGPRGNLSAFVEDVLRGRPFAAIPANVVRKSGPTQINHLVGQLAAHNVPVKLMHLFAELETRMVEWEVSPHPPTQESPHPSTLSPRGRGGFDRLPLSPGERGLGGEGSLALGSEGSAILNGYLNAMEQFLDVQRIVMEAYLTGHVEPGATSPLDSFELPDFSAFQPPPIPSPPSAPATYALIGRIEHLEPGREVVIRRVMDEAEDLYADHHTLAGRGVSRVDPGQNGLPVLPMTFSLEAMAEAALQLAPGKVVVAIRNIRLFRWLPFDPEPTTLEIRATLAITDPSTGVTEINANVRDLGNSFVRKGANKVACEAVVVLADGYPTPPEPLAFSLTDEQPCRTTVEDLRRNMFHGPLFQMIRSLGRQGKEGIEGTVEVQPRTGWFRSNPDPQVVLDPVLIDAAMHILGAWHLEQPDWTGRILLPYEVQRVEFFGPTPPIGSHLAIRGHNEQESARHFRHGLEMFDPSGRLWLRMTGAGYWRFYLPFGHVNFFGPKDEYFLSRNWPEAVPPRGAGAPRRCHYLDPPADLRQPVLRAAGARVTMTPRELATFRGWTGTDTELNDWFFARMLAKDAVRAAWTEKHGEAMFPADVETETDPAGRISCRPRGAAGPEPFPPVTVAITDGRVVAFSAFAKYVGISLVQVPKGLAETELRARAARAAVADALGIVGDGLSVSKADESTGLLCVSLPAEMATRYHDLSGRLLRVQTARQKDLIVATTLCEVEPK